MAELQRVEARASVLCVASGYPWAPSPPRTRATCHRAYRPGGAPHVSSATPGRQPPGPHSYGQANVATVAAVSASAASTAAAAAYGDAYGDAYGTDTTDAAAEGSYYYDDYGEYYYYEEELQQYQPSPSKQYQLPASQQYQAPPPPPAPHQQQTAPYIYEQHQPPPPPSHQYHTSPALPCPLPRRLLPEHLHPPRVLCIYSWHIHLLMAHSVLQGEFDSSLDRVGAGLGLAGQSLSETVGGCGVDPACSEFLVSDNGATNYHSSRSRNMYDWVKIPRGKEKVLIGHGKAMRVLGVVSLNVKMHSKPDFNVKLNDVYVMEGMRFNRCSLHDAQARQSITLHKDGAHLIDNRPTFACDATGASLYETRTDPTPPTEHRAISALSGVAPPTLPEHGVPDSRRSACGHWFPAHDVR